MTLEDLLTPALDPPTPFFRPSSGTSRFADASTAVSVFSSPLTSSAGEGDSLEAAAGVEIADGDFDNSADLLGVVIGESCGNCDSVDAGAFRTRTLEGFDLIVFPAEADDLADGVDDMWSRRKTCTIQHY